MKKLSESLEALSARVKKLEDSATAAFEADRAKLEQRRREIDTALTADRNEWDATVREAADAGRIVVERDDRLARSADPRVAEPARGATVRTRAPPAIRIAEAAEEDAAVAIESPRTGSTSPSTPSSTPPSPGWPPTTWPSAADESEEPAQVVEGVS